MNIADDKNIQAALAFEYEANSDKFYQKLFT